MWEAFFLFTEDKQRGEMTVVNNTSQLLTLSCWKKHKECLVNLAPLLNHQSWWKSWCFHQEYLWEALGITFERQVVPGKSSSLINTYNFLSV